MPHDMERLTSLEYAHILQYVAQKNYNTILSKTQLLKLLFMCYGLYLAKEEHRLFDDDTPRVWPFGPVFPKVFRTYDSSKSYVMPNESIAKRYAKDETAMGIVKTIIGSYHNYSATALSDWSHQEDGPWSRTIKQKGDDFKWNDEIEESLIKEYFDRFAKTIV